MRHTEKALTAKLMKEHTLDRDPYQNFLKADLIGQMFHYNNHIHLEFTNYFVEFPAITALGYVLSCCECLISGSHTFI